MAIVDSFANQCSICGTKAPQLDRLDMEANKFITPSGSEATLVRNDDAAVVFSIDKGDEAGYYVYDKHSGFGGVQKR